MSARGELYGNLLRAEDGLKGWNFLNERIHRYAEQRLAEDSLHIEPNRLRNNLLSSQPMCFNLFAPLALDSELAVKLVSGLPGFGDISEVTGVKMEYAPPKETMLNDGTSFDAWLEYKRENGYLGFIGIETKLTEPFSQKEYDFNQYYQRWQDNHCWWWVPGAEKHFSDKKYNQLWRNHLLAFALRHQPESPYSEAFTAVLSHQRDTVCKNALVAYRKYLLPEGRATLLEWSLDDLINRWLARVDTRETISWLHSLRLRYLDLEASEAEWQLMRRNS
jgi:hypothetical protein